MKKELVAPDFFPRLKEYTRIVKPYANGTTRRQRIDWCIENCKKEFTSTVSLKSGENIPVLINEYVQTFYFECEQEAMMFGLSN